MNTMNNHSRHRGMSWEMFMSRRAMWSRDQRDEYEFYENRNNLDMLKNNHYPDNCDQCNHQAEIKAQQQETERQIEMKRTAEKKETPPPITVDDKPKAAPPPKRKATAQEQDAWMKLKQQETEMVNALTRLRAEMKRIDPARFDKDSDGECKICGVCYWGTMYLDEAKKKRHLASNQHKIKAGLIENIYPKHCDACNYDAKDKHAWEQHCAGKKHIAKVDIQTINIPTIQELEI